MLRRQFELHYSVSVLGPVGDLVLTWEAIWVPGSVQYLTNEPFHSLGITRGKCCPAGFDDGVTCCRIRTDFGRSAFMIGPRRCQGPLPLNLPSPVVGHSYLEPLARRCRLPLISASSAKHAAQAPRFYWRIRIPVGGGVSSAQEARVKARYLGSD